MLPVAVKPVPPLLVARRTVIRALWGTVEFSAFLVVASYFEAVTWSKDWTHIAVGLLLAFGVLCVLRWVNVAAELRRDAKDKAEKEFLHDEDYRH